jgi:hypothetical protein
MCTVKTCKGSASESVMSVFGCCMRLRLRPDEETIEARVSPTVYVQYQRQRIVNRDKHYREHILRKQERAIYRYHLLYDV